MRSWRLSVAQLLGYMAFVSVQVALIAIERPRNEKWLMAAGGAGWLIGHAASRGFGKSGVFSASAVAALLGMFLAILLSMPWLAVGWVGAVFLVVGQVASVAFQCLAILFRRYISPANTKLTRGEKRLLTAVASATIVCGLAVGVLAWNRPFSRPYRVGAFQLKFEEVKGSWSGVSIGKIVLSPDGGRLAIGTFRGAETYVVDTRTGSCESPPESVRGIPVGFSRDGGNLLLIDDKQFKLVLYRLADGELLATRDWTHAWQSDVGGSVFFLNDSPQSRVDNVGLREAPLFEFDLSSGEDIHPGRFKLPGGWLLHAFTRDERYALLNDERQNGSPSRYALWDLGAGRLVKEYDWNSGDWIATAYAYRWREHWFNHKPNSPQIAIGPLQIGFEFSQSWECGDFVIAKRSIPDHRLRWPFQIYEDCLPEFLEAAPFVGDGPRLPPHYVSVNIGDRRYPRRPQRSSWPTEGDRFVDTWAISPDYSTVVQLSQGGRLHVWRLPKLGAAAQPEKGKTE